MENINIELFPTRVADRRVPASAIPDNLVKQGIGGGYNPKNDTALIPSVDNAYARTIRLHESAHAIWSREPVSMNPVDQAIEDGKIHTLLQTTGHTRRDEVCTAIRDLRSIKKFIKSDRAVAGVALIRSAVILAKLEASVKGKTMLVTVAAKYHKQGNELLDQIITALRNAEYEKAKDLADVLVANDSMQGSPSQTPSDESAPTKLKVKLSTSKPEGGKQNKLPDGDLDLELDEDDKEELDEDEVEDELESSELEPEPKRERKITITVTKEQLAKLIPKIVEKQEKEQMQIMSHYDKDDIIVQLFDTGVVTKKTPMPIMYVHTLSPNVTRTVKGKGHVMPRSTSTGFKIRTNRLALSACNPNQTRLFTQKSTGGTILIDASGSMSLTDDQLYQLAEKVPAGSVAYFSGKIDCWFARIDNDRWVGDLVIYSHHGKIRRNNGTALPFKWGGNLVDYPAVRWLLQQPGPRHFICDGFYTGSEELATMTKNLVEASVANKSLNIYHDIPTFYAEWKKGNR